MAGVKGRSGSGGARPGAGRPRKVVPKVEPALVAGEDTLKLLKDIAFGRVEATPLQVRAAIAAVQYEHMKAGDGGKKDAREDAAKRASTGKFAAATPPGARVH